MKATGKFKVSVARIEVVERPTRPAEICVTFQIEQAPLSFQVPIFLKADEFDDTEIVRVARDALHHVFAQVAVHTKKWELTTAESEQLSKMSRRPKK